MNNDDFDKYLADDHDNIGDYFVIGVTIVGIFVFAVLLFMGLV